MISTNQHKGLMNTTKGMNGMNTTKVNDIKDKMNGHAHAEYTFKIYTCKHTYIKEYSYIEIFIMFVHVGVW